MAEHDSGAIGEGMDRPPYVDLLAAQRLQTANLFAVLAEADDREMTGCIRGFRAAYVEEAGSVGKLDHVVDMGVYADVLVQVLASLHRAETWPGGRGRSG